MSAPTIPEGFPALDPDCGDQLAGLAHLERIALEQAAAAMTHTLPFERRHGERLPGRARGDIRGFGDRRGGARGDRTVPVEARQVPRGALNAAYDIPSVEFRRRRAWLWASLAAVAALAGLARHAWYAAVVPAERPVQVLWAAGFAWMGAARFGGARRGVARDEWRGGWQPPGIEALASTLDWRSRAGLGRARPGLAWHGRGMARDWRAGAHFWNGPVRNGWARPGKDWRGADWPGRGGRSRDGIHRGSGPRTARRKGEEGSGRVRHGVAWYGMATGFEEPGRAGTGVQAPGWRAGLTEGTIRG